MNALRIYIEAYIKFIKEFISKTLKKYKLAEIKD